MDKTKKSFEILLLFAVFIIATCGLIYELVAGALASYLLGDSVKQFSFVIGIYLFSMGIGSFFSKFIKKNLLNRFIEIQLLIGLIGGMSSILLFILFDSVYHFQLILYLLVFITGCLVGLEIPLLMNILKDKVKFSDLVSNVFTFDYIGALLASILFPVLLVPKLGLIRTSLFFGMLNTGVAILLLFYLRSHLKNIHSLKFKSFSVLALLIVSFIFSENILSYSEQALYSENIIYKHSTPYQRIVLTHNNSDYRLYLNNNLQFSSKDEYRYHEMLVHPVMSMAPKITNVLVLGGGDGLAIREILKYPGVKKITLVDLDGTITKLFQSNTVLKNLNQNSLSNPKVKIINRDAFIWIKENKELFDVVIIDFPDPSSYSLGKLYSTSFYRYLDKVLTANALVSVQTTSPYFAPKSFWCIKNTIASVFENTKAYHLHVPSFGEWGFCIFSKQEKFNFDVVLRKVTGLKFYDFNFISFTQFSKDMLSDTKEVNRLDNQILVRYFDEEWGKY